MGVNNLHQGIDDPSPEKRAVLERGPVAIGYPAADEPVIPRRDESVPWVLSFAQQRLWFLDQLEPNNAVYNIARAVRLRGTLDVETLRRAFDAIVARHAVLRSTIVTVGADPVQVVGDRWVVELPVTDLSGVPEAERETELTRVLRAEACRPFNLGTDLMLRTLLVRVGAREHVLLLTMHHIASDEWSVAVFTSELTACYAALAQGRSPILPPLPITYADYATWQRQRLQGGVLQPLLAYWTTALQGAPPVLELPTDRPRPPVQSFKGATASITLPLPLRDDLETLSSREGATLFMTLLAAFKVLLARYTGKDDIVVGTPIANRNRAETGPLIGFFANTLVLRTVVSGNPTFRELVGRVREVALRAYDHQELPFEKLVEELRPERSLSWTPLVQVMFTLQDPDQPGLELPGLTASGIAVDTGTAQFDLTASVTETPQGLRVALTYNADLYEPATIQRMLGHWRVLLEGIAADPEARLSALPLLTEGERSELEAWGHGERVETEEVCLPELVEAQARRTPDAVAVVCGEEGLTYRQLNARANQLAHYLRGQGVGPETLVGVCLERSVGMVVGLLGVMKAGGAYVPLDPGYPGERVRYMLDETQAPVVLTEGRLAERLPGAGRRVICIDRDWTDIAKQSTEDPASGMVPANLAYVIYTSGSTGRPKGVMVPHRALTNLLSAMRQEFHSTAQDVWMAVTTLSFDIAALELYLPLLVGGRVVIASRETVTDGELLAKGLMACNATIVQATPATWQLLLDAGWRQGKGMKVLCGGEALMPGLAQRLLETGAEVWNLYGPTETTIWSLRHPLRAAQGVVPLGRPIANTEIYLLDAALQRVPVGVPGEIYLGGVGVARGYLANPGLTAEKFIPDPFRAEPEARLYKTGDLARYLADGNIEFLGRMDQQVKIRGHRIELGEIEAVLRQHPAVREVTVLAREDVPGDKRLVAYLVLAQTPAPAMEDLRGFLTQRLPAYMIPAHFMMLDTFPLTPNGKIDRRNLPGPQDSPHERGADYVKPWNPLEHQLAQIWEDILGIHPVGVTDNFFELGGHSLLAVRVVNAIEHAVGRRLPLSTLFEGPTIRHLAQALRRPQAETSWSPVTAIHPDGSRHPFFFLHGDYGGGGFYCLNLARAMGPEQPFYALHPHGLDGRPVPASIEAMATDHLATMRVHQPKGPYLLGGLCNGGLIAYEMARRLQAQGERVDFLVLIDMPAVNTGVGIGLLRALVDCLGALGRLTPWERLERFLRLRGYILRLSELSRSNHHDRVAVLKQKAARSRARFAVLFRRRGKHAAALDAAPPSPTMAGPRAKDLDAIYEQVVAGYIPRRYPGEITLFRLGASPEGGPDLGWRAVAANVKVHTVPGDTHTAVTRHVRALGERLNACLKNVQATLSHPEGASSPCSVHPP